MMVNNSWGKTVDLLHRSMSANLLRQEVIANNIANADTPNFKRSELNFEASLKKALDSEKKAAFPVKMSSDRHIPFDRSTDYKTVVPRRRLDYNSTSDNNGNNVDIEEETSLAVTSQLAYNLMVQSMSGHYSNINLVLRG
jgi:flagellar basal-body rod protein FlgB